MDEGLLRNFRSLADEVRTGFREMKEASGELRVIHGYLESKDTVEAYRALCLPVRRAYKDSDRVSIRHTCEALQKSASGEVLDRVNQVTTGYDRILQYLDAHTILNDQQLSHRRVFDAWLDASIFGDFADKNQPYRALLDECGKAVEGIAVRLTEMIGTHVLELDEVVADALGEDRRA
jgi:hypothetical protein